MPLPASQLPRTYAVSQEELAKRGTSLSKNTKPLRYIDLNTDVGQSRDDAFFASEAGDALLSAVSSVNLPCFVHDGLPDKVLSLAIKAKSYGCALGAHIAYPDPASLGYNRMALSMDQLEQWILVQLGALNAILKPYSLEIEHVRPHGALYQAMSQDEAVAQTVGDALRKFDAWLPLIAPETPYATALEKSHNLIVAPEIILGKRYIASGVEAPKQHGEWLSLSACVEQGRLLVLENEMLAQNGTPLKSTFKSLHISPTLPDAATLAERLVSKIGKAMPLNITAAGQSGWLDAFDTRQDVQDVLMYEDY
jgi:5-oxoprolinase (ATP-hydrolysing) subunit A